MSPGATFERVYHELKRMLAEGELPPGTPIEPALISRQIASSITPIRDALHRLTGERLVEAPNHNGFRAPLLTESELRDLYGWRLLLLMGAVRRPPATGSRAMREDRPLRNSEALFHDIATTDGGTEQLRAVQQANDRLGPFHAAEATIFVDLGPEFSALVAAYKSGDRLNLAKLIRRFHQRRQRAVPDILNASRPFGGH